MVPAVNLGKKAEKWAGVGRSRTEGQGCQTCYKIKGKESAEGEWDTYCQLQKLTSLSSLGMGYS